MKEPKPIVLTGTVFYCKRAFQVRGLASLDITPIRSHIADDGEKLVYEYVLTKKLVKALNKIGDGQVTYIMGA